MSDEVSFSKVSFIKCAVVVGTLLAASGAMSSDKKQTTLDYLCYNSSTPSTETVCYDSNNPNAESDAKNSVANADVYQAYGRQDAGVKIKSNYMVQL